MAKKLLSGRIIGPDLHDWIDTHDELSRTPNPEEVAAMDAVVHAAFQHTQMAVHVHDTGKLRASGYMHTDVNRGPRQDKFSGRISYGRGLKYAKYEFGRDEGGWPPKVQHVYHPSHDVFTGMDKFESAFDKVIDSIGGILW